MRSQSPSLFLLSRFNGAGEAVVPRSCLFDLEQLSVLSIARSSRRTIMNRIIYIVGLVVIVLVILSFLGLR